MDRPVRTALCADLGDDNEIVRVRMKRLADNLVGDLRAVEIAGVDVIDALRNRLAQHSQRGVAIFGRAEDAGTGEMHGPVADPIHGSTVESECFRHFEARHRDGLSRLRGARGPAETGLTSKSWKQPDGVSAHHPRSLVRSQFGGLFEDANTVHRQIAA